MNKMIVIVMTPEYEPLNCPTVTISCHQKRLVF